MNDFISAVAGQSTVADLFFRPESIAIVGASNDPAKISGRPLNFLLRYGYPGRVYPVNPHRREVQGLPSYASITDIGTAVDLALIVMPAPDVVAALRECAAAGVRAAIIFASGFAETNPAGAAMQTEITAIVRESGMRLLGPNCLGSFAVSDAVLATFSSAFDISGELPQGPIALVTQSGAVGTFTYSTLLGLGVGVSYFANTGNQSDVSVCELLTALAATDDVDLLLGHLEHTPNDAVLIDTANAARLRDKPLVLLKAGRTVAGRRAIGAHTASQSDDPHGFDAQARANGVLVVHSMESMVDAVLCLRGGRRALGNRLTIVTLSGGAGALTADAATDAGLLVEEWGDASRDRMSTVLPYFGATGNPIDMTGALLTDAALLPKTLAQVIDHENTDAVAVVLGNADAGAAAIVEAVHAAYTSTSKPVVVVWTGGSGDPRRELLRRQVPDLHRSRARRAGAGAPRRAQPLPADRRFRTHFRRHRPRRGYQRMERLAMTEPTSYKGKVALVTGGTGGVGLVIGRRLAEAGATVVLNGRSVERGERALKSLADVVDRVSVETGDSGDYASISAVAAKVAQDHGAIDVLVSAGGEGGVGPKPFAEMTGQELELSYSSRFFPRIFPVHAALPYLRERGGSVLMLTTDAARVPTPGESIVGAVGAGIILLTKTLAKEFSRYRIRVNSVAMTITSGTTSWDRIFGSESFQKELFTKAVSRFPQGRPPDAEEVAAVAVFLAGDGAAQVTGQTVSVNGGLSFGGW